MSRAHLPRFLAALALLAGGALARAADDVETLVARLDGPDTDQRYPAYQALAARRDPAAIPALLKSLPGFGLTAQGYGISILQSYPLDLQHPALRRLMGADATFLRGAAAAVLARAGDAKATTVLVEAVSAKGADPAAVSMLLGHLYGLKDARLQAALRSLIAADGDPEVVGGALYQLFSVEDVVARADASRLLSSPHAGLRALGAAYQYRFGDEERGEDLAKAFEAGDVPYSDFWRIRTFLTAAPRVSERVLDAVASRLEAETNGSYVAAMIGFLSDHRHAKSWPLLRRLLDSPDANVAKAAFDALAHAPGSFSPDDLKGMLASPDEARRLSAAVSLRRLDDLSGLAVVVEIAKGSQTASTQLQAAEALGGFRVAGAVEPLIDLLSCDKPSVRSVAASSLATVLQTLFPYRRLNLQKAYAYGASAEAREAGVKQIRDWWAANKSKEW